MIPTAWIAAAALVLPPSAQQSAPALSELPARRPIAGLGGFQSVSSVRYSEAPELEHELTCTYVFPARARWQLAVPGQPQLGRHVEFRYGQRFFELPQSAERSRETATRSADGSDWTSKCELLELRLAVFLWPDGFAWREDGPRRRAAGECGRELVALLDAQGRPTQVSFAAQPGQAEDELRISVWREQYGRRWPAELELWRAGQPIWKEQVTTVVTQVALLDSYFLPPDRRGPPASAQAAPVLHFDAPAQTEVREPVAAGEDWTKARERWSALATRIDTQLPPGWERLSTMAFELSASGEPESVVVRLRGRGAPPAFAVETTAAQALTTSTPWPPSQAGEALKRLDAAKPLDARAARRVLTVRGDPSSASAADVTLIIERER